MRRPSGPPQRKLKSKHSELIRVGRKMWGPVICGVHSKGQARQRRGTKGQFKFPLPWTREAWRPLEPTPGPVPPVTKSNHSWG